MLFKFIAQFVSQKLANYVCLSLKIILNAIEWYKQASDFMIAFNIFMFIIYSY